MADRLTTIRRRWADFPRLRYIGHKPTPAQVAGRTDGFDDAAEISTVDQYATTMSWHDDATPALRDLLHRWSKAPEDVRWLVREVERLRAHAAQLEAACLLLDEARSHAVRERDEARMDTGSVDPRPGVPRWAIITEDGDVDGYVWAESRGAAMWAASQTGIDGNFAVMEDDDD